mgnify:FL=1
MYLLTARTDGEGNSPETLAEAPELLSDGLEAPGVELFGSTALFRIGNGMRGVFELALAEFVLTTMPVVGWRACKVKDISSALDLLLTKVTPVRDNDLSFHNSVI